jgi:hypothetical protein
MGWKPGRVSQLFGVWLRDSFATELLRFRFILTVVRCMQISSLHFDCESTWGLVLLSWLCFQMNMGNYTHVTIAKDGRLCSTG